MGQIEYKFNSHRKERWMLIDGKKLEPARCEHKDTIFNDIRRNCIRTVTFQRIKAREGIKSIIREKFRCQV